MNASKTILVIGGTGMLGKPVAQQLKADGFNLRLLARNPEKAQKLLGAGYEIVKGDVDDSTSLRAALTGRAVSPPVFDVMAVLGKAEALARLRDQA